MLLFFNDLSSFFLCHFSFPIAFRLSQLTATTGGEFKLMNSSRIVYPYLLTPISKPFLVIIYLFCSRPVKSQCYKIFELSLATTTTVLKPISCDHVISFNYDGKRARDVGLTCWCHLSSIMLVFIYLFFCVAILLFSSGWKRWNQFYHYNISERGKILNYNRFRQMGLISLQWDFKSETSQGISD